jgi:hypothetical protein
MAGKGLREACRPPEWSSAHPTYSCIFFGFLRFSLANPQGGGKIEDAETQTALMMPSMM